MPCRTEEQDGHYDTGISVLRWRAQCHCILIKLSLQAEVNLLGFDRALSSGLADFLVSPGSSLCPSSPLMLPHGLVRSFAFLSNSKTQQLLQPFCVAGQQRHRESFAVPPVWRAAVTSWAAAV